MVTCVGLCRGNYRENIPSEGGWVLFWLEDSSLAILGELSLLELAGLCKSLFFVLNIK